MVLCGFESPGSSQGVGQHGSPGLPRGHKLESFFILVRRGHPSSPWAKPRGPYRSTQCGEAPHPSEYPSGPQRSYPAPANPKNHGRTGQHNPSIIPQSPRARPSLFPFAAALAAALAAAFVAAVAAAVATYRWESEPLFLTQFLPARGIRSPPLLRDKDCSPLDPMLSRGSAMVRMLSGPNPP